VIADHPYIEGVFATIGFVVTGCWIVIMGLILWDEFNWRARGRP
jgi:hypothetical protein